MRDLRSTASLSASPTSGVCTATKWTWSASGVSHDDSEPTCIIAFRPSPSVPRNYLEKIMDGLGASASGDWKLSVRLCQFLRTRSLIYSSDCIIIVIC